MGKKEEDKIERLGKIIKWISIVAIVTIIILSLLLNSATADVKYYQNRISEDYEYKCNEGQKRVCIDEDKRAFEFGEDEDYVICDTDRKEVARCIDEDIQGIVTKYGWITECPVGEEGICIDRDTEKIISKE